MAQLTTAAQNLTAAWADLGEPQNLTTSRRCCVWINLDINDSLNARIRALAKLGPQETLEYSWPIKVIGSSDVKVDDEYIEFNVDADQQMVLQIETNGLVPWVQFQVMAGTAGASPGQIDNADITFSDI